MALLGTLNQYSNNSSFFKLLYTETSKLSNFMDLKANKDQFELATNDRLL